MALEPKVYNAFEEVRKCASEFSYQWRWSQREKRENLCLAVSRVYLEIALAEYKNL